MKTTRTQKYLKEEETLLKKYKILMKPVLLFPQGKVPFLSRVAVWVMNKQGGKIDIQLIEQ